MIWTTNLDIVAHQKHPYIGKEFPNGNGLFQRDSVPCRTVTEFKVLTWAPHSPDLIQAGIENTSKIHGGPTLQLPGLKGFDGDVLAVGLNIGPILDALETNTLLISYP